MAKALTGEDGSIAGQAEPGETLTYQITLTNAGGTAATAYGVTDPLDPNVTFVSADNGGTAAAGVVTWTGLTVPANNGTTNGTLVLTVKVKVNNPIPAGVTRIANLVYKTGGTVPTCTAPDPRCVFIPTVPQVSISKALTAQSGSDNSLAEPGETLTYTITLTNTGGTAASNQVVNEVVPAYTNYVAAGSSAWTGTGCVDGAPGSTPCTYTVATVPAQVGNQPGVATLTFVVKVVNPLPSGATTILNIVGLNGPPVPCSPANPQPWCVVRPTPPNVTMQKQLVGESGSIPGVAEPGETLTYQITLTNTGGSDKTGYSVTDQLDPYTTFASADNNGDGTSTPGSVIWNNLTVPKYSAGAPGTVVLTVVVTVANPIPQGITEIDNLVYQTGTPPPPCPPAGPQCVVTPTAPNIAIAKALTGESLIPDSIAEAGEQLTYTITVRNWGGTPATGTIVNEQVPDHTTFVSGTPAWTCAAGAPALTACSAMVNVPAATSQTQPGMQTLTFVVKVDNPLPEGVTQIVNSVGYNNNPPPNCTVTGPQCVITPTVNLSMTKTVVSVTDNGSGTYTVKYEIAVSNTGGAQGSYTLSDTPNFTTTGVTFIGKGLVTTTGGTVNPALSGGQFTPTNGTPVQLSGNSLTIAAGETDLYDVSIRVGVTGQLQNGACTGQPGSGYYNAADLTGTYVLHSAACAPVSGSQALISLVKNVTLAVDNNGNKYGDPGDVLGYTFTITNTGTETLSTLQLFDTRASNMHCVATTQNGLPLHVKLMDEMFYNGFEKNTGVLLPLDSITCTGSYVLTQQDVNNRVVTNSATVQASSPSGQVVTATGTATFKLFQ